MFRLSAGNWPRSSLGLFRQHRSDSELPQPSEIVRFSSNSRRVSGGGSLRRRPIFLLRAAHHDLDARHPVTAAAKPSLHPTARASKHCAPRPSSRSPASPWDGPTSQRRWPRWSGSQTSLTSSQRGGAVLFAARGWGSGQTQKAPPHCDQGAGLAEVGLRRLGQRDMKTRPTRQHRKANI